MAIAFGARSLVLIPGRGHMAGEHKFNKALQKRLFDARKRKELTEGREITLQMIADGISRILPHDPAPCFTTVGKWMQGVEPSTSRQMWALAKFLGEDPGDLLFGGRPGSRPMPDIALSRTGAMPKRYATQEAPTEHPKSKKRRARGH